MAWTICAFFPKYSRATFGSSTNHSVLPHWVHIKSANPGLPDEEYQPPCASSIDARQRMANVPEPQKGQGFRGGALIMHPGVAERAHRRHAAPSFGIAFRTGTALVAAR